MTMDLRQLRALLAVARAGGFSRAAKEARITQPTLSAHIRNLERTLGVRLFDRYGRTVALTPAGQVLASRAERILELCDESVEAVHSFLGQVRGRVAVESSTVPGEYLLPRWLAGFSLLYPEVEVALSVRGSAEVIDRVASGQAPIGVTGLRTRTAHLSFARLCADEIVLVGSPSLTRTADGGPALPRSNLRNLPLIRREDGSGTQIVVEKALAGTGVDPETLHWVARLGSTRSVIEGALAGMGAAFVSRRAAARELRDGALRLVPGLGLTIKRDFFTVTSSERTLAPAAARLLSELARSGAEETAETSLER